MIKIILNTLLYVIITLFIFNSECLSSSVHGPKIFGLQLGMDKKSVEKAVNEIANKINKKFNTSSYKVSIKDYEDGSSEIHIPSIILASISKNGKMYLYWFPHGSGVLFNSENYLNKDFLQKFINNYHIPKISPINTQYGLEYYYIDYDKHYQISIGRYDIKVENNNQKKPKEQNYKFE